MCRGAKLERSRSLQLVFEIFPVLAERRRQLAGSMRGGEQRMLVVGRGLLLRPRLPMLDEPSLGLGTAILLVEQNASRALRLVQRAYVLESGRVIMDGSSIELAGSKEVQAAYLGV